MMQDYLSIYFIFIIVLVSIPILIYSIGYVTEYKSRYSVLHFWIMTLLFILSMLGVILSNNSLSFLVFWELMSVFSFFLVIFEYENKRNIKNGIMYFIMTHISGLFLMVMFSLIVKYTDCIYFTDISTYSNLLTNNQKTIIFIFALLGFGAKAGLIPIHAWLPKAHPSAPSNISALMSGVMLKVALYGFIRVVFIFLGGVSQVLSIILIIVGTLTAIFSILNSLLQNDLKKLLAYSSAENIGIIFSLLGLSLLLKFFGQFELSILSLTAALFHALNHAVFKSLLFTSAGSVLYSTSSKNMNELGGLYNKLKFTSICAFVGTAAMSAIPPFNGFPGEILILKSFIVSGASINAPFTALLVLLCGIILAFTSGGVIFTGVKSFGLTFLGSARTEKAVNVHKTPITMNIGMGILAVYSLIIGLLSPIIIKNISKLSMSITNDRTSYVFNKSYYEITIVSIIIITISFLLYLFNKFAFKNEKVEIGDTWGCGFNNVKSYMQYSPSGFSQPAAKFAGNIANYRKDIKMKETIFLKIKMHDIFEKYLYKKIISIFDYISGRIIKIHYGRIQLYITYIFVSLIAALILVIKFI